MRFKTYYLTEAKGVKKLYRSYNWKHIDEIYTILMKAKKNGTINLHSRDKWDNYSSATTSSKLNYGRYGHTVVFDYNELSKINKLIEVKYDKDFIEKHPDIFKHVVGFNITIEDYKKTEGRGWLGTFKGSYSIEKEVLLPLKLKVNKKSIIEVNFNGDIPKEFTLLQDEFKLGSK